MKTKDYIIFGGVRRLSIYNHKNIKHINYSRFNLINFDLNDSHVISKIFEFSSLVILWNPSLIGSVFWKLSLTGADLSRGIKTASKNSDVILGLFK